MINKQFVMASTISWELDFMVLLIEYIIYICDITYQQERWVSNTIVSRYKISHNVDLTEAKKCLIFKGLKKIEWFFFSTQNSIFLIYFILLNVIRIKV